MARWKFRPIELPTGYSGPATYKIRLVADDVVVSIPRFFREDGSGVLQIGVTNNLENRRRRFVRGLAIGTGHSEANLLHMLERHSALRRIFRNARYEIAYRMADLRKSAATKEELLLKAYLFRFGEVPPLNSAIPRRYT
jgi:hypothetical protein